MENCEELNSIFQKELTKYIQDQLNNTTKDIEEKLFNEEYAYFSSFSTEWLIHAKNFVNQMVERFKLTSSSVVGEVAANDGYLLQFVKEIGIGCYGIEPTASTANAARQKGIEIIQDFLNVNLASDLRKQGRTVNLLVANNVLAHVPDINDFSHASYCLAMTEFSHVSFHIY